MDSKGTGKEKAMRIKNINTKEWYDIPGHNQYQINYFAEVRKKLKNGKFKKMHPYVKKSKGKQCIKIDGKEEYVFTLMRITFIGALPKGMVAYHRNGIKTDDELSNIGVTTRSELSKMTSRKNGRSFIVAKLSEDGEIVEFYKSAREAGRKNHMSYQTVLNYVNGETKKIFAPDGYAYCRDKEMEIQKTIRRIEMERKKECGICFIQAPSVIFEF